jgi:elongation factor P
MEGMRDYLLDEMTVMLESYDGEPISVKIPTTVELRVVWAEPAIQGDTANAPMKQVELETGSRIQAPLFVQEGDLLRVDTREGTYVTRVR